VVKRTLSSRDAAAAQKNRRPSSSSAAFLLAREEKRRRRKRSVAGASGNKLLRSSSSEVVGGSKIQLPLQRYARQLFWRPTNRRRTERKEHNKKLSPLVVVRFERKKRIKRTRRNSSTRFSACKQR